jgi:hypothetical protein
MSALVVLGFFGGIAHRLDRFLRGFPRRVPSNGPPVIADCGLPCLGIDFYVAFKPTLMISLLCTSPAPVVDVKI